jgi:hypothetical protein
MTEALDLYKSWGVVDFMQRNDQKMVQFYLKATQETVSNKSILDITLAKGGGWVARIRKS